MRFRHFLHLGRVVCLLRKAHRGAAKDVAFLKGWGSTGRAPVERFFFLITVDLIVRFDSYFQVCKIPHLSILTFIMQCLVSDEKTGCFGLISAQGEVRRRW